MSWNTNHLRPLPHALRHNIDTFTSQPLAELSGSLGDLGTLLPLMTALAITGSISLPATLLLTGAANILTGIVFGIPLPVQPMKAIAAVAIARKFSLERNACAGLVVAGVVGVFSVTGLITWANRVTPVPVVKGIQVGAGLSLCLSAGTGMLQPLGWTSPWWGDNLLWVVAAVLLLLCTFFYSKMQYALVVFVVGIVLSILRPDDTPSTLTTLHASISTIPVLRPSWSDFLEATTTASLGQVPLTLLNSVIAASALATDLLPSPPYPVSPTVTELGLSVASLNLIGCWFGAMPICHGSGGLAGQVRFGARSGSSIILLGAIKLILGFISFWKSDTIIGILSNMPRSLLGVLVLVAGIELAKVGESVNTDARDLRVIHVGSSWDGKSTEKLDERTKHERWMTMLVTVVALLAFHNDAVGFVAGLTWHWTCQAVRMHETSPDWRDRWSIWRGISCHREESDGLLSNER